ncbi:MAG: phosphatidate cytidylyltransferase [Bacteroidota bacterium]
MKSNFWQRTITAVFFATGVVTLSVINGVTFSLLMLMVNFFCLLEFYELVLPDKRWIEKYLGIIAGSIIYIMFALIITNDLSLAWYYHIIPVFLAMFIIKLFEKTHNEFSTLAFQVLGIVYITLPLVMLTKLGYLNSLSYSPALTLGFILLLWTCDTGAYLAGRNFGKHKLFERVSPKKTWEGSIGALILVLIVSFALSKVWDDLSTMHWIVSGIIILVVSTFGDLFESLLKRNLHIKDSGSILPGHGGVLDRFDGLFIAVPAWFFYLLMTN